MNEYPLYYAWRLRALWGKDSPLYGRRCRIIARALHGQNGRLVEFENGERHIVMGSSLRKGGIHPQLKQLDSC